MQHVLSENRDKEQAQNKQTNTYKKNVCNMGATKYFGPNKR
jgi:hypothetical protein